MNILLRRKDLLLQKGSYLVRFFDYNGNEFLNCAQEVEYGNSAILPTLTDVTTEGLTLSSFRETDTYIYKLGWDVSDKDLKYVTRDLNVTMTRTAIGFYVFKRYITTDGWLFNALHHINNEGAEGKYTGGTIHTYCNTPTYQNAYTSNFVSDIRHDTSSWNYLVYDFRMTQVETAKANFGLYNYCTESDTDGKFGGTVSIYAGTANGNPYAGKLTTNYSNGVQQSATTRGMRAINISSLDSDKYVGGFVYTLGKSGNGKSVNLYVYNIVLANETLYDYTTLDSFS